MATAPSGNKTLHSDDVMVILEEILPAQNKSYNLGLKLKVPLHVVRAIHAKNQSAEDHLRDVLEEFLKRIEPRPTWRVIINALRSPTVNLSQLANAVEATHFPDSTSTRDIVPKTIQRAPTQDTSPSQKLAVNTLKREEETQLQCDVPSPPKGVLSCKDVQAMIDDLDKKFDVLKNTIRECLEKQQIAVKRVADVLTSLSADDAEEHQHFLEGHVSVLFKASDHSELFGTMNFHWNYLSCPLLGHLVKKFDLEELKGMMEAYKEDLQQFRKKTPLTLFCQTQKKRRLKISPEFQEVVVEFDWPHDNDGVTLEVVEQFRQEYACHYNLRECAMMLAKIRPGSFVITWYIPQSIVEKLRAKVPRAILKKYDVTKLEIAGSCVYRLRNKPQEMSPSLASIGPTTAAAARPRATSHQSVDGQEKSEDKDYPFIEQPSDDFFCPVTYGLLLQPYLTSCCGKHLSQEATTRIQREGGACPLCMTSRWSTVLNKYFQRQVNALHVFCHHEDRGCGWHGELSDLERHVKSCPMTDLLKSSLYYKDGEMIEQDGSEPIQKSITLPALPAPPHPKPLIRSRMLTIRCHRKKTVPFKMTRGSATTDCQFAYFVTHHSDMIYSYEWHTEHWNTLPSRQFLDSTLVMIDGALNAVGGYRSAYTNQLHTLQQGKWIEKYPPKTWICSSSAVVSTSDGDYIIVIGGHGYRWEVEVELFKVKTRRWYKLTNLPHPLPYPSATICGNQLYVIGDDDNGYMCSLQSLPSNDEPITLQSIPHLMWTPLPHLPVTDSTVATLYGELVIIGGVQAGSPVNFIHQLVNGQWVEIGAMSISRRKCLVVSPSPYKVLIVGGYGEDSVEECVVSLETEV